MKVTQHYNTHRRILHIVELFLEFCLLAGGFSDETAVIGQLFGRGAEAGCRRRVRQDRVE
jgi:hypothetical protein